MANTSVPADAAELPDWWQREKQRRQARVLLLLLFVLTLIGYYYWVSLRGRVVVGRIDYDTANHIAFVRQDKDGNTDLYAIRADGNGLKRLTQEDDKAIKSDPVWTMDGKKLLYVANLNDARTWQVYILGDGDPKQLTYGTGNKSNPVANPNKKQIGFLAQGAIKTVYLNGNEVYQIMPPPSAGNPENATAHGANDAASTLRGPFQNAAFSMDGDGVAGVKNLSGEENPLTIGDLTLGDQAAFVIPPGGDRSIMLDTGREVSVAWDPKGPRIACAFTEATLKIRGKQEMWSGINIYSFPDAGKAQPTPMLLAKGFTLEPKNISWSPDGSRIAFECWRLKGEDERELRGIVVITASAKNIGILTAKDAEAMQYMVPATADGKPQRPQWSPDGSRLLYEVVRKDGGRDLWVINASDGTNALNLTKGEGDNSMASWSPLH